MGAVLADYFQRAEKLGGVPALVRLASLTLMTSFQARLHDDAPELVARFDAAFAQLVRERGSTAVAAEPGETTGPLPAVSGTAPDLLLRAISELVHQRPLYIADPVATMQRVTEACAGALGVARASVWLYDEARSRLACSNLFEAGERRHSSGLELFASQSPRYFKALQTERVIAAADALADARTAEFGDVYLRPLRIGALLDAPVWASGRMVGVLCSEHVGGARSWSRAEADFSLVAAGIVALAFERAPA